MRVMYIEDYKNTDIYPIFSYSDAYSYFTWAKDIQYGDLLGSKAFMKWPFYAYFLGFLFRIFGENISVVYILQFMLGAINCALVYLIAKIIFNDIVGFLAALFCMWYGLFLFYDGLLIYSCLSIFLNSLLFLLILSVQKNPHKMNLFWVGIFLGLCTITQANIIILGISAIVWILWKNGLSLSKLIYHFFSFLLGLSIIIGAVTLRNYWVEKDFVLIAGNLGLQFYCGNNPEAKGTFYCPIYMAATQEGMFRDARVIAKLSEGRNLKTSEVSRFWMNKSLSFIKQNPATYLKLLFKKLNHLFSPKESIHELEFFYMRDKIKIFRIMFLDLSIILPFALLGMFLNLKKINEKTALLYLVIITLSFSIIPFFVTTRYRISIVPFLSIFASSAVLAIWEGIKKKEHLKLAGLCLITVALFILMNSYKFSKNRQKQLPENYPGFNYHLSKAIYHTDKADYQNALQQVGLASQIQPNSHASLLTEGTIYYHLHNLPLAEEKFKEVIKIFSFSVNAYYNLGILYNNEKRFAEAQEVLEEAVFLDPEDIGAHFELGKTYKAREDYHKAKEEFGLALKKINRWRTEERRIVEQELSDLEK